MEGALFSDDIFRHEVGDGVCEEADELNEETFGLCDGDLFEPNDDWEKQHEAISKLFEYEAKRNTPKKCPSDREFHIPSIVGSPIPKMHERDISLSDAEDELIENTINSLGLDDESHYEVKTNTPVKSLSFEESHFSWNSPIRGGKEHRSDSLQELISPGDGVWVSPSRDNVIWTPPGRENAMIWPSPGRNNGSLWSSPAKSDSYRSSPMRNDGQINDKNEDVHTNIVLRKLVSCDDELEEIRPSSVPPCSTVINSISLMPTTPVVSAIRAEDLERELKKGSETKQPNQPTIIERHRIPPDGSAKSPIPFPVLNPKELAMKNVLSGFGAGQIDINRMTTLLFHQQMLANYSLMNPAMPHLPHQHPMSPHFSIKPNRTPKENSYRYQMNEWSPQNQLRADHDSFSQEQRHMWNKELHPSKFKEIDYEQFIDMEPSKMMNAKEKKWIFKISLMSLLNGDPHSSDYYFISHVINGFTEKTNKKERKEMRKNLEKTNQLMTYVQQQQDTKESHKPVKFKGSLGKLSITSVHHPRQIMDFSTPEHEQKGASTEDGGKKKFLFYSTVEKMYSLLLCINGMERELDSNKEQKNIVESRLEKINELFNYYRINVESSLRDSDLSFFSNIMSISKGRKLIPRVFMLFTQEQSEALFLALITLLPSLLKKDKEETLKQLSGKLSVMLMKSEKQYRLKCIQLLRKVDLKTLLTYSASILVLATLLDLLEEKKHSLSLEWSYYVEEVPKILPTLGEVTPSMQPHLEHLKSTLGLDNLLGVNIIS